MSGHFAVTGGIGLRFGRLPGSIARTTGWPRSPCSQLSGMARWVPPASGGTTLLLVVTALWVCQGASGALGRAAASFVSTGRALTWLLEGGRREETVVLAQGLSG